MSTDDLSTLREFYLTLPEDNKTIRIIRRSAQTTTTQYVTFTPHAEVIAAEYLRSMGALKAIGPANAETPMMYVTFSEAVMKEIVVETLSQGEAGVEIYADKQVIKKATPGNTQDFDDLFFAASSSVMSVKFSSATTAGSVVAHCAYVNVALRNIGVCSFLDSPLNFQNLKAFMVSSAAKECIVDGSTARNVLTEGERKVLEDTCTRHGVRPIHVESTGSRAWDLQTAATSMIKVCRSSHVSSSCAKLQQENSPCISSIGGALDHLGILQDEANFGQFKLVFVVLDTFMKLDIGAIQALHLMGSGGNESRSVYDTMKSNCCTPMGQRLLRFYLAQPLTDVDEITRRQNMTGVFKEDAIVRESMRQEILARCPDMDKLLKRLQKKKAYLKDAILVSEFTKRIDRLKAVLSRYDGNMSDMLLNDVVRPLGDHCVHFQNLQTLIDNVLEIEDTEHGGHVRVRPDFDEALLDLDSKKSELIKQINAEFKRVLGAYKWTEKQIKLEPYNNGFVLRVSRKDDKDARQGKEFVILQTNKDGIKFVTGALSNLNTQYKGINEEYVSRQQLLQDKFLETVATYAPILDDVIDLVAQLDVFASWAAMVTKSRHPFTKPVFDTTNSTYRLKKVRHLLLGEQDTAGEVISNDITFTKGQEEMYIVTGPNMGGKSTLMRSVALVAVLAQMGCYVPCEEAVVPIFDSVLCRVGAGDMMAHGVSTFMREMQETAHILSCATNRSLVVIDELGRGTSTYDGFGIAWAVAEYLAKQTHCFTLLATHFHELTALASPDCPAVRNVHVTANCEGGQMVFPYVLMPGPCMKSFGLNVAEMARFPQEALDVARQKAEELEQLSAAAGSDQLTHSAGGSVPNEVLTKFMDEYSRSKDKKRLRESIEEESGKYPELKALLA